MKAWLGLYSAIYLVDVKGDDSIFEAYESVYLVFSEYIEKVFVISNIERLFLNIQRE